MTILDVNGLTEQEFLARYKPGDFPRPSVTADVVVIALPSADTAALSSADSSALPSVLPVDGISALASALPSTDASAAQETVRGAPHVLLIRRGAHPYLGQ